MGRVELLGGQIERSSSVPYYVQLRDLLASAIRARHFQPGDLLPSEAELQERYGVSRTVIRKALDLLDREGRLRRMKGRGTTVVDPLSWDFHPELTGLLVEDYHVRTVFESELRPASPDAQRSLGLSPASPVIFMHYCIARANEQGSDRPPAYLVRMEMRTDATRSLAERVQAGWLPSLPPTTGAPARRMMAQLGVRLSHSLAWITPAALDAGDAEILGLPAGTLTLRITSLGVDVDGRPVSLHRSLAGSDNTTYRVVFRHDDRARSRPAGSDAPESAPAGRKRLESQGIPRLSLSNGGPDRRKTAEMRRNSKASRRADATS